jgi:hypothetical protein
MTTPIGGQLISSFGGPLGFKPYQGLLPAAGSPPPTTGQTLLDITSGELKNYWTHDDTTHTGTWSAEGTAITCTGFEAAFELLWDLYRPPPLIVQNGGIFSLPLSNNSGVQLWMYIGNAQNYPRLFPGQYWFAPSAKVSIVQTVINAGERRMIRALGHIKGNSPIFLMGGQVNEQSRYDAYIAHCYTRNWAW